MKTHNTDGVHQIDVTRGRKNTNRAGSRGIDVLDSSTEVSPVTSILFPDATVTDGDDGIAIVQFGGSVTVVGEVEPDAAAKVTISAGADHRGFPGVAWLDQDEPHIVGHRFLIVYRHGASHLTGGKIVGEVCTVTDANAWTFTQGSPFDIEDLANSVGPADGVSVIDDTIYIAAYEYNGSAAVNPHVLICDDPASSFTSSSTWTRHDVIYSSGSTYNVVVGRVRRLQDGDYILSAYWQSPGTDTSGLLKVTDPTDWSSPTVIAISNGYNENDIEEMPDGTLHAHLRNTAQTFHYSSTSTDAGATWSAPVQLYDAGGLPMWRVLTSGIGLTVYRTSINDTGYRQTPSGTLDQGWGDEVVLDATGSNSSYATILQLGPNAALVVWGQESGGGADPTDSDIYSQVFVDSSVIGTAIAGITVQDEGAALSTLATTLNFVGAGVTAAGTGSTKTVTIAGTPTGAAGGDLSGTYPNPSVVNDSHTHTSTTLPVAAGLIPVDTGAPTYVDSGDDVEVSVATVWGYDGTDGYYDSTGAVDGEQAALYWKPDTGEYVLVPYEF